MYYVSSRFNAKATLACNLSRLSPLSPISSFYRPHAIKYFSHTHYPETLDPQRRKYISPALLLAILRLVYKYATAKLCSARVTVQTDKKSGSWALACTR